MCSDVTELATRANAWWWLAADTRHSTPCSKLATLADQAPGTEITWAVRRKQVGQLFGGEQNDALPERGRLGARTRELDRQRRRPLHLAPHSRGPPH